MIRALAAASCAASSAVFCAATRVGSRSWVFAGDRGVDRDVLGVLSAGRRRRVNTATGSMANAIAASRPAAIRMSLSQLGMVRVAAGAGFGGVAWAGVGLAAGARCGSLARAVGWMGGFGLSAWAGGDASCCLWLAGWGLSPPAVLAVLAAPAVRTVPGRMAF